MSIDVACKQHLTALAAPKAAGHECWRENFLTTELEAGDWLPRLRGRCPNASAKDKAERCTIGYLEDGGPDDLGQRGGALARRYPHVDVLGGRCGPWDRHLDAIARNVLREAQSRQALVVWGTLPDRRQGR